MWNMTALLLTILKLWPFFFFFQFLQTDMTKTICPQFILAGASKFKSENIPSTLSQTIPGFYMSAIQILWKHCGEKEILLIRSNSPFPSVFSTHLKNFQPFSSNSKLPSADSSVWKCLKFVVWERDNSRQCTGTSLNKSLLCEST